MEITDRLGFEWIVERPESRSIQLVDLLNDLDGHGFEVFAILPDETVIARRRVASFQSPLAEI